jgi:beta-glucanase (GH16 family)
MSITYTMSNNPEIITCLGHEWWTRHRWGSVHPLPGPRANCWYGPEAVRVLPNGTVELAVVHNPRGFDIEGKAVHADYCAGTLCSVADFGFGRYTLVAKLPAGNYLWPAFWLYCATSGRPEEIDIFEAYARYTGYRVFGGLCGRKFRGWDIRSCLHTGTSEAKLKPQPAIFTPREKFDLDPTHNFVKYEFIWTRTMMVFLINDITVRYIDDDAMLAHFAKYASVMVIINNHIDGRYAALFNPAGSTPFSIAGFAYEKY